MAVVLSSDGTYTSWTPSTGSTHYTLVDETTCNGTTDHASTATAGNRDSYGISLSSVPDGSTITSISITPCASRNSGGGGGSATMNVFYRFNGTNSADAGAYALSGTTPVALSATNFNSLSFVKGSASTLQIGAVYSAGTKGARLSRVATVLTFTPLTAPSVLNSSAVSSSQINLSWTDNSSNESGFKIERSSTGATGPFTQIATTSANATSFNDTGLTEGTTYWYRVQAYNAGGSSSYTSVSSATTLVSAPTAPSGLNTSVVSQTAIDLSWTDNSSNESGFKVERSSTGSGGTYVQIATTSANSTTFSDTGLSAGTTYWYKVRAYNAGGNSAYTVAVSGTTLANAPTVATNSSSSVATSSATLNGSANPNGASATGWFRYSSTNPGICDDSFGTRAPTSGGTSLGSGSSNVAYSSGISGLSEGTTYYVCAISSNNGGNGYGSVGSFTTIVAAPSSLSTSVVSQTAIDLSWTDNSSSETGFKVERSIFGPSGGFVQIATTSAGVQTFNDTGLSTATTYWYRVRAFNGAGNSSYSNVSSGTTLDVLPNAPTSLSVTVASSTNAVINWADNSSNEDEFVVEKSTDGVDFSVLTSTTPNTTQHVDSDLTAGTYYYRVKAVNEIGSSDYTSVGSVNIP